MPKQGITVEQCVLTKWHKKVGEHISVGEVLFSYETDKAAFDQESEVEGEILAQFYKDGDEVPVLVPVCAVGKKGDDVSPFAPNANAQGSAAPAEAKAVEVTAASAPAQTAASAKPATENGKVFASPRAKHLAEKLGVDLSACEATGPKGRIVEKDVRTASVNGAKAATESAPAEAKTTAEVKAPAADVRAYTEEKMSNMRKVIAKNMMNSLSSMAQLTHNISFDCTNIIALRAFIKANAERLGLPNITFNDIILYAVSRVILNHKALNANLVNGDTMRYFSSANLGIAVDTPKGLLVPVLFGAERMSLKEIAVNAKKLAKEAQAGTLKPDLMSGGSFTVSNIGVYGIESFTPVINPPQTGILGVCALETRVKIGANGEIVPYQAMTLSLTYDHRALDGSPASKFLKELKEYLENFSYNVIFD
ncbi:MAG: 2-oxo acid dehydrogenase subunit E2 [Clostridia bacterium]|nr:2-oxo acid dehydrogenase subunit E2 [Clostridia bacterium]